MRKPWGVSWVAGLLGLLVSTVSAAQPADERVEPPPSPLTTEQRLEAATVDSLDKDCAPDPALAEQAKRDAKNARIQEYVVLSAALVEEATQIAAKQWAGRRAELVAATKADLERWQAWQARVLNTPANNERCVEQSSRRTTDQTVVPLSAELGLPAALFFGPRPGNTSADGTSQCADGRSDCDPLSKSRSLIRMLLGLSDRPHADPAEFTCTAEGTWHRTAALFSKVRVRLIGGQAGATLLLAGASNVPVACAVDVRVMRRDAEVARMSLQFTGAGQEGDIVKEISMVDEVEPWGDQVEFAAACVPRLVWSGYVERVGSGE